MKHIVRQFSTIVFILTLIINLNCLSGYANTYNHMDLSKTISILKVLSGMQEKIDSDFDNNNKIGLPDIIVAMKDLANQAPIIGMIADDTINEDAISNTLSFTLADSNNQPLTIYCSSSNSNLLPVDAISLTATNIRHIKDNIYTLFSSPESITISIIMVPVTNSSGSSTISITAIDPYGLSSVSTYILSVEPMTDEPILNITPSEITTDEDTAVNIDITVELSDKDGSEVLDNIIISNVPDDAIFSAGNNIGNSQWEIPVNQLQGLTITPPKDDDTQLNLNVKATSRETSNNDTASTTEQLIINVNAVADPVSVVFKPKIYGNDDQPIEISIIEEPKPSDVDGSETILPIVTIKDVPIEAKLSKGEIGEIQQDKSSYELQIDDLKNLTIIPSSYDDLAEFTIKIAITTIEENNNDTKIEEKSILVVVNKQKLVITDSGGCFIVTSSTQSSIYQNFYIILSLCVLLIILIKPALKKIHLFKLSFSILILFFFFNEALASSKQYSLGFQIGTCMESLDESDAKEKFNLPVDIDYGNASTIQINGTYSLAQHGFPSLFFKGFYKNFTSFKDDKEDTRKNKTVEEKIQSFSLNINKVWIDKDIFRSYVFLGFDLLFADQDITFKKQSYNKSKKNIDGSLGLGLEFFFHDSFSSNIELTHTFGVFGDSSHIQFDTVTIGLNWYFDSFSGLTSIFTPSKSSSTDKHKVPPKEVKPPEVLPNINPIDNKLSELNQLIHKAKIKGGYTIATLELYNIEKKLKEVSKLQYASDKEQVIDKELDNIKRLIKNIPFYVKVKLDNIFSCIQSINFKNPYIKNKLLNKYNHSKSLYQKEEYIDSYQNADIIISDLIKYFAAQIMIIIDVTNPDPRGKVFPLIRQTIIEYLEQIQWEKSLDKRKGILVSKSYDDKIELISNMDELKETYPMSHSSLNFQNQFKNALQAFSNKNNKHLIYIISSRSTANIGRKLNLDDLIDSGKTFHSIVVGDYGGQSLQKLSEKTGGLFIRCNTKELILYQIKTIMNSILNCNYET